MPKVSIICSFYNRAFVVARTMEGICGQTYADMDAYVVDDGSTDGTLDALSRYSSSDIHIFGQSNNGFTKTLIWAIAQTDCDYIALNDSEDFSHPRRIERQVEFLESNDDVGAIGCYCNILSEVDGRKSVWHADAGGRVIDSLVKNKNPIIHGSAMIRRSAYDAVGGYRPFFYYRQDLDLWLRIAETSRLEVVPEILYDCYKMRESVSEDLQRLIPAKACRDFAVHCSLERQRGHLDPLEKMGPVAALMRPRSRRLAVDYGYTALQKAIRGNRNDAKLLLRYSFREKPIFLALVVSVALYVPGIRVLGRILIKLRDRWNGHLARTKLEKVFG